MLPSYSELIYFREVASTLNISRAAERLGITQPSLSMALKKLENTVQTPLLIRNKNGVQLTKSGRFLSQNIKTLVTEWEMLQSLTKQQATEMSGSFVLGCHASVAQYTLGRFLPSLFKKYPHVDIRLEHNLSRLIVEKIIGYEIDFGIVVNPIAHPDLTIVNLCDDRVTLWSKSGDVQDILIYEPNLHQTQSILRKLTTKKSIFQKHLTSSSLEVVANLTSQGIGTGILPTRVAEMWKLKICNTDAPHFDDKICLVYRGEAQRTAAARAIITLIKDSLK
jgi:LysR family transcriptional regulator, cell division regulator